MAELLLVAIDRAQLPQRAHDLLELGAIALAHRLLPFRHQFRGATNVGALGDARRVVLELVIPGARMAQIGGGADAADDRELPLHLVRVLADPQISVSPTWTHVISRPAEPNPELLKAISQLTAEFWPGIPVIPTMGAGATTGSFLRNAGIPTFGTSGLAGDVDDVRSHGKDERVLVKSFVEGQEYLYRLVKALSTK